MQMILYETSSHYYIVGFDSEEASFRVLKIDRRVLCPKSLDEILQEDPCVYSKEALAEMLEMVNEGIPLLRELSNIDGCCCCQNLYTSCQHLDGRKGGCAQPCYR